MVSNRRKYRHKTRTNGSNPIGTIQQEVNPGTCVAAIMASIQHRADCGIFWLPNDNDDAKVYVQLVLGGLDSVNLIGRLALGVTRLFNYGKDDDLGQMVLVWRCD
jgi:hypothetical protein